MRVNKDAVIKVASELADKEGLSKVSLKTVAELLGIRTPSLYNHVESLEELLREIAHRGMAEMNEKMRDEAIGFSGEEAIGKVGIAYLEYVSQHPGVYETIQWAHWHENDRTMALYKDYMELLERLIYSCGFGEESTELGKKLLPSVLHGYSTLELGNTIANKEMGMNGLQDSLITVLLGLRKKDSRS